MEREARRSKIVETLQEESGPISGTELAKRTGVSRQVIVTDIALLRTSCRNILSTNRGYLLYEPMQEKKPCTRVVKVKHDKEDILRELYCIVDAGGRVLNVIVEHDIYGRIVGELVIRSRADARRFMQRVIAYGTRPLTDLTEGVHYHTIEAEQEETLDMAVKALAEEGFLAEES